MQPFKPARPSPWLLPLAQKLIQIDLQRHNTLHIQEQDLALLKSLPPDKGLIITPNHADETDPKLCLELARRSERRFVFMCNREAFDEWHGLAGLALQSLGYFSVERGGHDLAAKNYSIEVVGRGLDLEQVEEKTRIKFYGRPEQSIRPGN